MKPKPHPIRHYDPANPALSLDVRESSDMPHVRTERAIALRDAYRRRRAVEPYPAFHTVHNQLGYFLPIASVQVDRSKAIFEVLGLRWDDLAPGFLRLFFEPRGIAKQGASSDPCVALYWRGMLMGHLGDESLSPEVLTSAHLEGLWPFEGMPLRLCAHKDLSCACGEISLVVVLSMMLYGPENCLQLVQMANEVIGTEATAWKWSTSRHLDTGFTAANFEYAAATDTVTSNFHRLLAPSCFEVVP